MWTDVNRNRYRYTYTYEIEMDLDMDPRYEYRYRYKVRHSNVVIPGASVVTFTYRVAKTHRMPYLYKSFFAKEPYN